VVIYGIIVNASHPNVVVTIYWTVNISNMKKIYIVGEDCVDGSTSLRYFTDPELRELVLDYFAETFQLSEINNDSFECENFSEPIITPIQILSKLVIREHDKPRAVLNMIVEKYFPTYESIPKITLKIEKLSTNRPYYIATYYLKDTKLVHKTFSSKEDAEASMDWFKQLY
jgi:hypothetical protein